MSAKFMNFEKWRAMRAEIPGKGRKFPGKGRNRSACFGTRVHVLRDGQASGPCSVLILLEYSLRPLLAYLVNPRFVLKRYNKHKWW